MLLLINACQIDIYTYFLFYDNDSWASLFEI